MELVPHFDRRIENMKYSSALKINEWRKKNTVHLVYDKEMLQKYKNMEDRLISRIGFWIDINRIESKKEYLMNNKKAHPAKRIKRFQKFHTFAGVISKSLENWHENTKKEEVLADLNVTSVAPSPKSILQHKFSELIIDNDTSITTSEIEKNKKFLFLNKGSVNFYEGNEKSSNIEVKSSNFEAQQNTTESEDSFNVETVYRPNKKGFRKKYIRPSIFEIESFKNMQNISELSSSKLSKSACDLDLKNIDESTNYTNSIFMTNLENSFHFQGKIYNSIADRKKPRPIYFNSIHHKTDIGEV